MSDKLVVSKLEVRDTAGAGVQVYATLGTKVPCVEFTMREDKPQQVMISCEPWIQFAPKNWDNMIQTVFSQMVEAWNEKHGEKT